MYRLFTHPFKPDPPLTCSLALQIYGQANDQIYNAADDQIYDQIYGQANDQIYNAADDQIYNSADDQIYNSADDQIYNAADDQIYNAADDQIYDQIYDSANDQIYDQVSPACFACHDTIATVLVGGHTAVQALTVFSLSICAFTTAYCIDPQKKMNFFKLPQLDFENIFAALIP